MIPTDSGVESRKAPATTTDDDTPSPPRIGLNGKSSLPNVFANSPSRRPRTNSSLFSSMSRAKGKESLRALAQNQVQQPLHYSPLYSPLISTLYRCRQAPHEMQHPMNPINSLNHRHLRLTTRLPALLCNPPLDSSSAQHTGPLHSSSPLQHPGSPSSTDSSLLLPPAPLLPPP